LEIRHLILSIDQADRDVARHAAVAVDVGRRTVRGHRNAGRRAEVGAPDVVVEDEALCNRKKYFYYLNQACQAGGPRAACSPFASFMRPEHT